MRPVERAVAAIGHASYFLGLPIVLPLLLWLHVPAVRRSAFLRQHLTQAATLQAAAVVVTGLLGLIALPGFPQETFYLVVAPGSTLDELRMGLQWGPGWIPVILGVVVLWQGLVCLMLVATAMAARGREFQ